MKEKELARVGPNQPHFELMNVRIPVLQLENGAYRGISNGEMVPPDKVRRSVAAVIGSLR